MAFCPSFMSTLFSPCRTFFKFCLEIKRPFNLQKNAYFTTSCSFSHFQVVAYSAENLWSNSGWMFLAEALIINNQYFFASEKIDKIYIFASNQTFKIVRSSKKIAKMKHGYFECISIISSFCWCYSSSKEVSCIHCAKLQKWNKKEIHFFLVKLPSVEWLL